MKQIGLLGGSFDPPHRGHIYISLEAKKILSLDEIWWIVTPKNPLKISTPASYEQRVNNCKKIVKNQPILINEIENKIKSRYTYQTLTYLLNHYQNIKFYWLMGADNLIHFNKWQKWQQIFNKISIVIFKRHGYNCDALKSVATKTFSKFCINEKYLNQQKFIIFPSWAIINNKEIKISSSEIRKQRELLRS